LLLAASEGCPGNPIARPRGCGCAQIAALNSAARKRVYQHWRLINPRDPLTVNTARARSRAQARANRQCEHCGKPIEAARSTKRFCSDLCRVRAYRTAAAD
jgi:hypothetical protein